ncbi:MAG: thioredoxin fold domain-containing protein [Alphaproteobacteria bacterium]|nr:thioredoxin fold domain-containing protein [Alphaproteobacteria bacterium]
MTYRIMLYRLFRKFLSLCAGIAILSFAGNPVFAQNSNDTLLPKMPDPIQNLANEGAQIRFLGKDNGVDGWIAIKNGQEQYFYVLPNGSFLSGILFDVKGKAVTVNQVRRLREQSGELLDSLAADVPPMPTHVQEAGKADRYEFKTPSEQLYFDLENSNWLPVGQAGTPLFYSFIDIQCSHCYNMMVALKPYIESGKVQVRIIPVGFRDETQAQAAYMLAAPAPVDLFWRYLEGDKEALPASPEISKQGIQRNLSVMQSWKLSVTPLIAYRGKDGKVKIIRGMPKDLKGLIADLGVRS